MLEDRLRPRYSGRGQGKPEAGSHLYRLDYSQRSELRSPQQKSPQQRKARAIVAKYKKTVRYAQLYRLKSLVPAVKDKEEASEVSNFHIFLNQIKYFPGSFFISHSEGCILQFTPRL